MPTNDKSKQREYQRRHYNKNKEYYAAKRTIQKQALRDLMLQIKLDNPCSCGESDPSCLQFHHLDPKAKELHPANIVQKTWSVARAQKELNKCVVLCANCHLKLHAKERNS